MNLNVLYKTGETVSPVLQRREENPETESTNFALAHSECECERTCLRTNKIII